MRDNDTATIWLLIAFICQFVAMMLTIINVTGSMQC